MKDYFVSAVLLSLCLTAGCADRGTDTARNADDTKPPAADEARPAEGTREPAVREGSEEAGARATTGARTNRTTPSNRAGETQRSEAQPPAAAARTEERAPARGTSDAPARRGAEWREVTVPQGTALPLELETPISSATAQVETPVRARLRQAVVVNGITAIPAGAVLSGTVTSVERAGRVKGRSSLAFTFNQIRADNLNASISTAPISYVGEGTTGEDATKIGAGAIGGAIVGGIVGGGEGAAKGAAIGGAAGTGVVLATRGKDVELAAGTSLAATLAEPVTIRVPAR